MIKKIDSKMEIIEKFETKKAKCAIIGLGYVGLPLLIEFARAGYDVIGVDIDKEKIDLINSGQSYIQDVSTEELKRIVDSGRVKATTDYSKLKKADVISICVPTPLRKSKSPDISYIVDACSKIAKYLRSGQLIILESTTYPGSTEEIVLPIFTRKFKIDEYTDICEGKILSEADSIIAGKRGKRKAVSDGAGNGEKECVLEVGKDFFLAFSPERVDPGNPDYKTKDIPKVIGGFTPACTEVSADFYQRIFPKVVPVSSTRSAEMVKLLENTFRSVNIALANEMSLMCDSLGVDVWEVINAAATKPFGFMPFYPGPGLGGHCIPIDPLYLTWKARLHGVEPKFVELASEVNQKMPRYITLKMQDALNKEGKSLKGSKIIVVGVAYKRNVSDVRESPSLDIIKILENKGADVSYYDPYVPQINSEGRDMVSVEFVKNTFKNADGIIIATDHSDIDYRMIADNCKLVIDTRNALSEWRKK